MTHSACTEQAIDALLFSLPDNECREGLRGTPERAAKAWAEWTDGYGKDPTAILKTFKDGSEGLDELVFQEGIPVYSHCEHHLAPFFGVAHIGYVPTCGGGIVGLSKLSRLVDIFAHRLQVQERLTAQIAQALQKGLTEDDWEPKAVGVVLRCRHLCMESRGIRRTGTVTKTTKLLGAFRSDPAARAEFMSYVQTADQRSVI